MGMSMGMGMGMNIGVNMGTTTSGFARPGASNMASQGSGKDNNQQSSNSNSSSNSNGNVGGGGKVRDMRDEVRNARHDKCTCGCTVAHIDAMCLLRVQQ